VTTRLSSTRLVSSLLVLRDSDILYRFWVSHDVSCQLSAGVATKCQRREGLRKVINKNVRARAGDTATSNEQGYRTRGILSLLHSSGAVTIPHQTIRQQTWRHDNFTSASAEVEWAASLRQLRVHGQAQR
jgi:hypothetical protein